METALEKVQGKAVKARKLKPKVKRRGKEIMGTPLPEPKTFTCKEAMFRHVGITHIDLIRMCQRGLRLRRRYGSPEAVPLDELRTRKVLFAKKVGKYWSIPVSELDRVFLPD